MTERNNVSNCFSGQRARKTVPPDQIDILGYCLHPRGDVNRNKPPSSLTEYQLKYCTFKLENAEQLDVSRAERARVIDLMGKLWTVQQRSYTDPHDSHYPVIVSKAAEPPLDRSKEAESRHFKMNGRTEYQLAYDRCEREEIV